MHFEAPVTEICHRFYMKDQIASATFDTFKSRRDSITMGISPWATFFLIFGCCVLSCCALEVSTPNGKIIGFDTLRTRDGRVIHSFTGIPFAKPPIGPLRFKEPQPADPWKEPLQATNDAIMCPQADFANISNYQPLGQEDCLVLHVYSPKVDRAAKLPVMVWIHGGGFQWGAGSVYGPELLLDKDVVLVTINYRLGALGFLSTGDNAIPANLGLKDQALAIKWVHDNIVNFGGNPDLVTIFGESAGGGAVHLNLLSPLNKGRIHRVIAMSGTGYGPWAIAPPKLAKDRTKALAVLCSCPTEPSNELAECMRKVPADVLLEMGKKFNDWIVGDLVFVPTIESETENAFLPKELDKLGSEIPYMTGLTSGEGGIFASIISRGGSRFEKELKENPQYVLSKALLLKSDFPSDKHSSVAEQVRKFYFGDKPIDLDNTSQEVVNMFTDRWFLHGAVESAKKHHGDAYLYLYDHLHSISFNDVFSGGRIKGVSHADDLLDIFPLTMYFPERKYTEDDIKVSRKTLDIVTDFAKIGKLTGIGSKLQPVRRTAKTNQYLHITAEPAVKENLYSKRLEFWQSLIDAQSEDTTVNAAWNTMPNMLLWLIPISVCLLCYCL
nr:PREDICTED: esterase E4-like isoform X3 [Bemisia tabaci]